MNSVQHIEIIPAVLPKNFSELEESLGRVAGASRIIQVDIVDGIFAPNKTWPFGDEARFEKICMGDEGLPHWENFDFQFDLMLEHPEAQVQRFIDAGASSVVVHAKSPGAREALELLAQRNQEVGDDLHMGVGLALASDASPEDLEAYSGLYDFVQVMGIEKVGFQGEAFNERALGLIQKIRTQSPSLTIQVDGGVSMANAKRLCDAGANRLVVGSAIFGAPSATKALGELQMLVQQK